MGGPPITLLKKGFLIPQMGEKKEELDKLVPLDYIMSWFGKKLESRSASSMSDRIVILRARTASGKSTSIAPSLYLRFFNKYKKHIVITQPRVLTAIEIPKDINTIDAYRKPNKQGLSIELYRNLGYQTQDYVRKTKEKGILFTTTGVLLQYLKTMSDEQFCRKYKFIIIDEAHDRSLDVDLILLMMKQLIKRNLSKDAPFLIVMSATLNVEQYSAYFNTKTIFEVNGASKPIEVIYPSVDVSDIYSKTYEIVSKLDEYEKEHPSEIYAKGIRDVIVFMPATAPIKRMISTLMNLNKTLKNKILLISITSADISGGSDGYRLIMEDVSKLTVDIDGKTVPAYRRVIVSTNVAETGLTLETLRYCIDTGLQFSNEFNHRYGINIMTTKPTTSSMSLQRKGRVGRKYPGVFFPLYTEYTFNKMIVDNTPSITSENMTFHLLTLLINASSKALSKLPIFDMLTPPSDDSIKYSLERLFTLGAIDNQGMVTTLGTMINTFRKLSIESCKMILSGLVYGVSLKELICLACLMTVKKTDIIISSQVSRVQEYTTAVLFDELYEITPTYNRDKCDTLNYNRLKAKLLIGCEMIELLLIYQRFTHAITTKPLHKIEQWCIDKGLNFTKLCSITEFIDEVQWGIFEKLKINPVKENDTGELYQLLKRSGDIDNTELVDSVIKIKKCIYEGYKNNLIVYNSKTNKFESLTGLPISVRSKLISNLSYQKIGVPFDQNQPKLLLYKELITRQNTKTGQYEHEASTICVLDGYVHVNQHFTKQ